MINIVNANISDLIQKGALLPATIGSCLLSNGKQQEQNTIENIASRIIVYIKDRKKISVSELVEYFNESPDIIFMSLKILRDKGLIQEVE